MIEACGAYARALADDMLIIAVGDNSARALREALDATHQMLIDLGANIATHKSMTCSTCALTWLRQHNGES